jgi:hypothetical protein
VPRLLRPTPGAPRGGLPTLLQRVRDKYAGRNERKAPEATPVVSLGLLPLVPRTEGGAAASAASSSASADLPSLRCSDDEDDAGEGAA